MAVFTDRGRPNCEAAPVISAIGPRTLQVTCPGCTLNYIVIEPELGPT